MNTLLISSLFWSTAEIANTWIDEGQLFKDIKMIEVSTLIIHGIHDKKLKVYMFLEKGSNQIIG